MRILHCVESYPPSVGGMQYVVRTLSEGLVRLGHEVTVATSHHPERAERSPGGVRVEPFRVSGNLVRGLEGEVERYRAFLREGDFDVVALFAAQQWSVDVALEILDDVRGRKVFVPTGFSALYDPKYAGYFERMPGWLRRFDATVFLSDDYRDVNFARKHGIANGLLIPNGASEAEFGPEPALDVRARLGVPAGNALVLHVGSFTGSKGQPEAIAMFRKARLRRTSLVLVGDPANPRVEADCARAARRYSGSFLRRWDGNSIHVGALDRRATVEAFKAAELFLFPSNIECSPIVLFEAAAAGTPFLSTDAGNAAEIARWTGAGEIMATRPRRKDAYGSVDADVAAGAAHLRRLMGDRARLRELGARGRAAWRERFTWERIVAQYEALYSRLVQGRTARDVVP